MTIYIVVGSTGEYEFHTRWNVKAFVNEQKALELNQKLNALVEGSGKLHPPESEPLAEAIRNSLDPKCSIDYTGTEYNIEVLELE
jgi:hypothetical protein